MPTEPHDYIGDGPTWVGRVVPNSVPTEHYNDWTRLVGPAVTGTIVAAPLTEADVRRIVREELTAVLNECDLRRQTERLAQIERANARR